VEAREIVDFVGALDGVAVQVASAANGAPEVAWGDTFFFYDPDDDPRNRRLPFATIVVKDYEGFDTASHLDREGVFRVNVGVSRETFGRLFGSEGTDLDPAALDTAFPHPTYGAQSWVSIINPDTTAGLLRSLLLEAHTRAVERHGEKR
jgi:hypothetical protein